MLQAFVKGGRYGQGAGNNWNRSYRGIRFFSWWLVGGRIQTLQTMGLNEVGDFLAGAFGPLAILWLVLGFFQQGIELRQGTAALNLQASELKASVDQQKELVGISTDQLNMAKANAELENRRLASSIEPKFSMNGGFGGQSFEGLTFRFRIFNGGHTITCFKVSIDSKDVLSLDLLGNLQDTSFVSVFPGGADYYSGSVVVSYLNGLEEPKSRRFNIELSLDAGRQNWIVQVLPKNGLSES
ncbi:DUF805 domain-containing protein [Pseudomonas jessenii]